MAVGDDAFHELERAAEGLPAGTENTAAYAEFYDHLSEGRLVDALAALEALAAAKNAGVDVWVHLSNAAGLLADQR